MPKIRVTNPIEQAFFDTWREYDVMPDEEHKRRMRTFKRRWKGLDSNAFKHALQEGNDIDRLFALFALGYLAPNGYEDLLLPFLSSPLRRERWGSAMMLGLRKDERVFALLGQMLIEQMELHPPEEEDEYHWFMGHRITIISILTNYNDPRAIPVLRHALEKCLQLEQLPPSQSGSSDSFLEALYQLEDELAYALGSLKAWNSLDGLNLSAPRLKLTRLYIVIGSLHLNLTSLRDDAIILLLQTGTLDPQQIVGVLEEQYGEDSSVARASVQQFGRWYQQRIEALRQRFELWVQQQSRYK